MRKGVRVIALAFLLLTGCASTVDGRAQTDTDAAARSVGESTGVDIAPPTEASGPTSQADPTAQSSDSSVTPSTSVLATSSSIPVTVPDGFEAFSYFGYRGVPSDATCPQDIPDCVGVEIYSIDNCPTGAKVVLDYYKEQSKPKTFLGETSGATPPIGAGMTQSVFLAIPADIVDQNPYGYIKDITC